MPPSAPERGETLAAGRTLAIAAEALYLFNLLLAPGLAFVILLVLYFRYRYIAAPLAACHMRQTISASIWAGIILVVINLLIVALGGYEREWTWVIAILYFTVCHATLVLLGALGLASAINGKVYRYPLIGRSCRDL